MILNLFLADLYIHLAIDASMDDNKSPVPHNWFDLGNYWFKCQT